MNKNGSRSGEKNTGKNTSQSGGGAAANDDVQTLTHLLRTFGIDCLTFFRKLREFMMAAAAPLKARIQRASSEAAAAAKASSGLRSSSRRASNAAEAVAAKTTARGESSGGADVPITPGTVSNTNTGDGLDELEAALSVSELRTMYVFTKVAAGKYTDYLKLHFDRTLPGGEDFARFGWRLFLIAKHTMLPKFPDLYSCYHLLVVVQAFLLVNAPPHLLATDLKNMVSMSVKDENGDVDALASLSATSKTKMVTLKPMLIEFQNNVVERVLAAELAKEAEGEEAPTRKSPGRGKKASAPASIAASLKPSEKPGDGLSPAGPLRYPDLFLYEPGRSPAGLAAAAAGRAYVESVRYLGHLRLDETLYFWLTVEEEADSMKVLGDGLNMAAQAGGSGGVAATPGGHPGASTPWHGGLFGPSPSRLGSAAAYSPYSSRTPGGVPGSATMRGGGSSGSGRFNAAADAVPFTPISQALASASWLHSIVSPTCYDHGHEHGGDASAADTGGTVHGRTRQDTMTRLELLLSPAAIKKLMRNVHHLAGKTSAALREDAFLVHVPCRPSLADQEMNEGLDKLVKCRQEEAVQVFTHFLVRILESSDKKVKAGSPERGGEAAKGMRETGGAGGGGGGAFGSVADIAALAAEQTTDDPDPPLPEPVTPAKRAAYERLCSSPRFVCTILACSMEVVVRSYKTATLKFPAIPHLLGVHGFDVANMIVPFLNAEPSMPRELRRHFKAIDMRILESMGWAKGSTLFAFMRAAEMGLPCPGPAALALAALDDDNDNNEAGNGGDEDQKISITRNRSFSVAAVASAAADEPSGGGEEEMGGEGTSAEGGSPPRGPGEKTSAAFAAFSTPLRCAVTPARPPGLSSQRGAAHLVSANGNSPEPLPKRFVREPEPRTKGDGKAYCNVHNFIMKTLNVANERLRDLIGKLRLRLGLCKKIWNLVEHILYDHTSLMFNRHLDQILLCAVYGVCKVNKDHPDLNGRVINFREIIRSYRRQPQCREEIFWTVIIKQTDPELEVLHKGDIISFYNQVFVPEVKSFLLSLKHERSSTAASPMRSTGGDGGVSSGQAQAPPMSPSPALYAPRRVSSASVYVSPMRPEHSAATQMTPRSKSLFAFVGESAHPYQSPARDLNFINRRVAAAASGSVAGGGGGATSGVAAVAEAVEAAASGGGYPIHGVVRPRSSDDGDSDAPPAKSARRSL